MVRHRRINYIGRPARRGGRAQSVMNEYFVYVLSCSDGTYYKGMTGDINRRLDEHLAGKCAYTRGKTPKVIFVQVCETRKVARELEMYLKTGVGREIIRMFF